MSGLYRGLALCSMTGDVTCSREVWTSSGGSLSPATQSPRRTSAGSSGASTAPPNERTRASELCGSERSGRPATASSGIGIEVITAAIGSRSPGLSSDADARPRRGRKTTAAAPPEGDAAAEGQAGELLVVVAAAEALRVLLGILDATAHEERLLGQVVVLALGQLLERVDRLVQRGELALDAGELLGDEERLGQESLDAPGPVDGDPVLLGELVHTEDGDDVLEILVALQDLLGAPRDVVVLLADVAGVEDARGAVQRVDGRVDTLLRDRAGEHRGGVEVGERGVRRRVGDVVGRHVDRLQRRDRVTPRGGDPLLQLAHLVSQRRLVTHGTGHPAEQRGDFLTGLGEPED